MKRSAVICRTIILLVCSSVARSAQPLKFPVVSPSEQFRNALVVSQNSEDWVYVGSSTSLYRLNSTLSKQATHTPLTSFNAMLLVLEQANSLLACQRDSCLLLDSNSLQNNQTVSPPSPSRLLLSLDEDNKAVLTSSSSSGASLFVGKANALNNGDRLASAISRLSLTVSGSPALSTDIFLEELNVFRGRSFFASFQKNGFVYFVFSIALTANAEREVRIARICSNDTGGSNKAITTYSEVQLVCNGGSSGTYYSATIHDGQNGAFVLLALHDKSSSMNFICSFDLSTIDSAMDETFTMCVNGVGTVNLARQTAAACPSLTPVQKDGVSTCKRSGLLALPIEVTPPITSNPLVAFPNSQPFQSLLVTELSGAMFIYAGSNGILEQFHLNQSVPSATHIRSQSLNLQKNITELHFSTNREFVYVLTSSALFRYPVDVCSQYTSCDECLMSGDPICGWCTLSRSCSRQVNCLTNPWLQGEVSVCPMIRQVEPSVVYVNQLSQTSAPLTLSVANIPSSSYQCVFNYTNTAISTTTMATIVNATHITCILPPLGDLPQFAPGQGTQFVSLSLRTMDTVIDVVTVGGETFGFTNCTILNSCFQCLEARRGCQWCSLDRSCKSPMESKQSCNNNFLEGEATSVCTFIEGPDGSNENYLVHADMNKTLSIHSSNLQLFSKYSLRCVLSNEGMEVFNLPAVWNNQSSEVECQNYAFVFAGLSSSMPTITLTLEVRVMTNTGVLSIENPRNIRVVLYSCPFLGLNCGQCLDIDDAYGCGYCRSPTNRCILTSTCSFAFLTMVTQVNDCENPTISSFSPTDGPNNGGTMITINGSNLGAQRSDISSVWIQNVICDIVGYSPGRQIQCTTRESLAAVFGAPISVNFTYTNQQANSPNDYNFRIPALDIGNSARPSRGPRSGGTKVTIRGRLLGIGSSRTVQLNGRPCIVDNPESISIDADNFTCTTTATTAANIGGMGTVIVNIDSARLDDTGFNYVNDPTISEVIPPISFIQGGTNVTVIGSQLDAVEEPQILIYIPTSGVSRRDTSSTAAQSTVAGPCSTTSSTVMQCTTPMINMTLSSGQNTSLGLGFRMDGVTALLRLPNISISYYGNPTFEMMQNELVLDQGAVVNITIMGEGFVFTAEQVQVTVDDETGSCGMARVMVNQNELDVLMCTLSINNNAEQGDHDILVDLGVTPVKVGVVLIRPPIDPLLIIIPVFAFVVIVGVALFIVVVATLCHKYKKKDEQSDRLILELERLESSVAHECKQGFAELQTDLDEITGDLAGCRLPYHNFRLYIIRSLFPGQKDHSVLHGLQFPSHRRIQMERGLRDFVGLLHDKTVLLTMIHSLERQKQRFTIRDKSNVGSLLLIALHDRLDYATEILKSLLSDLVRRTVTESHPKLLLRRTESVAEKMLSSWLVFTLHEYVVDHVGQPLYLLYKAVKSQLEKGPIDVITGEARYSLSEQKLIRQQIDVNVINATIVTDDGSELYVKLLDCDSISQAKEKILDALYKASQVSLRPSLVAVDLELRSNPKEPGYLLRDDDSSNFSESGWRKINTLKHYRVPDNAMFRLVKRRDTPAPGRVFDYVGNLAVTPGTRSRTLSEADDGTRVWHLFKQVEEDPRSSPYTNHSKKMVTEIYLPRMLSTKTILQKFVDDLFRSMFSTSHPPSSPVSAFPSYPLMSPTQAALRYTPGTDGLPTSVKYLFDFLDDEAANAKIGDLDVVHMWKNNSIPLRFWVNLIKNPEFVFDINKSAVVDSSLSVIAQAIIDGCSTSDTKPTINSPTSKLLYSKEVQGYKASVKGYYSDVQDSPRVSDDYMMQYLRELSAHQAKLFQHAGGFHPECAQYEILRYTVKYKDVIIEGLRGAGLEAKAQIFENVLQNVM